MLESVALLCVLLLTSRVNAEITMTAQAVALMGMNVQLTISSNKGNSVNGTVYWPFVNGTQWGAFVTCDILQQPDAPCTLLLPMPLPGQARIQVAALDRDWCQGSCFFPVGQLVPPNVGDGDLSNTISVSVVARSVTHPLPNGNASASRHVCMDWEPWFTRNNLGGHPWLQRPGAEGVPLVGLYSSFNALVVRQHAIWLTEAGVDCILVDWSNNLWGGTAWSDRSIDIQQLINGTTFALEQFHALQTEGLIATPQVVIMMGLTNGPPASPQALQDQAAWVKTNYIDVFGPERFLALPDGPSKVDPLVPEKPALVFLDTRGSAVTQPPVWNVTDVFAVRYMGAQLQDKPTMGTDHGYWSWMDGSLTPVPAMRHGVAEALTVTPGFFTGKGGWLGADASGWRAGATFVKTMESARMYTPSVLLVCQWNEFAGQPTVPGTEYVDSYNLSLTNDMEPVSLTECGYTRPGDQGQLPRCDTGWGMFPVNLLRASLGALRGEAQNSVLRILTPEHGAVATTSTMVVEWTIIGTGSDGLFIVKVDGIAVGNTSGQHRMTVDLDAVHIRPGAHNITVIGTDGWTKYALSKTNFDHGDESMESAPTRGVSFTVPFAYQPVESLVGVSTKRSIS
eukprot:m.648553 g.648553  ORF g.648553 m.648553 type:complete len:623 (-) comp22662_c0_seq3:166-2034(-)